MLNGTLPPLDVVVAMPPVDAARLQTAARHVLGDTATAAAVVAAQVAVRSGDECLGAVLRLGDEPRSDADEVLELAAPSALPAIALRDARVTRRRAAAALLEDLCTPVPPDAGTILSRARQLGADRLPAPTRCPSALRARRPNGRSP